MMSADSGLICPPPYSSVVLANFCCNRIVIANSHYLALHLASPFPVLSCSSDIKSGCHFDLVSIVVSPSASTYGPQHISTFRLWIKEFCYPGSAPIQSTI